MLFTIVKVELIMEYIFRSDDELEHHGILGMHWGIRRFQNEDGTLTEAGKKRYREAEKDAKEYARAKMFYGKGAGNRRKLIKATVESKSKDPAYKEAFDYAMSKQDMGEHAKKAKGERKRKDIVNATKKTGRGAINIITGHPERAAAAMVATAAVLHVTGLDKKIVSAGKTVVGKVMNEIQYQKWRRVI